MRDACIQVIATLYPDGVPDMMTLSNKALCAAVAAHLPFAAKGGRP